MSPLDPALLAHILAWFSSSPHASQIGFCGLLANLGGLFSLFVGMVHRLAVRQVFQKDHCVSGRNLPVTSIMHINPEPVTLNQIFEQAAYWPREELHGFNRLPLDL